MGSSHLSAQGRSNSGLSRVIMKVQINLSTRVPKAAQNISYVNSNGPLRNFYRVLKEHLRQMLRGQNGGSTLLSMLAGSKLLPWESFQM